MLFTPQTSAHDIDSGNFAEGYAFVLNSIVVVVVVVSVTLSSALSRLIF